MFSANYSILRTTSREGVGLGNKGGVIHYSG